MEAATHINVRLAQCTITGGGNLGMSFYSASRSGGNARLVRARACAVRDPTRGAVGEIMRMQYGLPDLLAQYCLALVR